MNESDRVMVREENIQRVLVCVNDKKSRVCSSPVCYDSWYAAERDIKRILAVGKDVRDGQKPLIAMYPEDFVIMEVGRFDYVNGNLLLVDNPRMTEVFDLAQQSSAQV